SIVLRGLASFTAWTGVSVGRDAISYWTGVSVGREATSDCAGISTGRDRISTGVSTGRAASSYGEGLVAPMLSGLLSVRGGLISTLSAGRTGSTDQTIVVLALSGCVAAGRSISAPSITFTSRGAAPTKAKLSVSEEDTSGICSPLEARETPMRVW